MSSDHDDRINEMFRLCGIHIPPAIEPAGILNSRIVKTAKERDGTIEYDDYFKVLGEKPIFFGISYSSDGSSLVATFGEYEHRSDVPRSSVWGQNDRNHAAELLAYIEAVDPESYHDAICDLPPPFDKRNKKRAELKKDEDVRKDLILNTPENNIAIYANLLISYLPQILNCSAQEYSAAQQIYRERHKLKLIKDGKALAPTD